MKTMTPYKLTTAWITAFFMALANALSVNAADIVEERHENGTLKFVSFELPVVSATQSTQGTFELTLAGTVDGAAIELIAGANVTETRRVERPGYDKEYACPASLRAGPAGPDGLYAILGKYFVITDDDSPFRQFEGRAFLDIAKWSKKGGALQLTDTGLYKSSWIARIEYNPQGKLAVVKFLKY